MFVKYLRILGRVLVRAALDSINTNTISVFTQRKNVLFKLMLTFFRATDGRGK